MKKIYLGNDKNGNTFELDFDKEKINFVLLIGQTGSGKSIFHYNLYKELSDKYSQKEIGFVFLDMTRVDFGGWSSDYLIKPVVKDSKEAIAVLHELTELKTDKKIFIHIEESDMVHVDRKSVESAFNKLKEQKNIYIIYSTSRTDKEYLRDWMKDFINLKVVFTVSTDGESVFLLGSSVASNFINSGEKVLAFNDHKVFLQPFSKNEAELLDKFKL